MATKSHRAMARPKTILRATRSSRIWDADRQEFKREAPTEIGFAGPFKFVITRGKQLAITGIKNGKPQVAWSEDPNYEDWTGRFED